LALEDAQLAREGEASAPAARRREVSGPQVKQTACTRRVYLRRSTLAAAAIGQMDRSERAADKTKDQQDLHRYRRP
jgi:hypothetical protein